MVHSLSAGTSRRNATLTRKSKQSLGLRREAAEVALGCNRESGPLEEPRRVSSSSWSVDRPSRVASAVVAEIDVEGRSAIVVGSALCGMDNTTTVIKHRLLRTTKPHPPKAARGGLFLLCLHRLEPPRAHSHPMG